MKQKLLIIDALNLIRRIFAVDSVQNPDPNQAIKNSCNRVSRASEKLVKLTNATHAIAVFDGASSWRHHYYPQYKSSRDPMPDILKSSLFEFRNSFNQAGIVSFTPDNDEADDVIATLADKAAQQHIDSIIVSTDKGFIPHLADHIYIYDYFAGHYLGPDISQSKFGVHQQHLTELWGLAGDKTNDIPGVKGIGKKTAQQIINQFGGVAQALKDKKLDTRYMTKLEANLEKFVISKQLATLRCDIHLGFNLKSIRIQRH